MLSGSFFYIFFGFLSLYPVVHFLPVDGYVFRRIDPNPDLVAADAENRNVDVVRAIFAVSGTAASLGKDGAVQGEHGNERAGSLLAEVGMGNTRSRTENFRIHRAETACEKWRGTFDCHEQGSVLRH